MFDHNGATVKGMADVWKHITGDSLDVICCVSSLVNLFMLLRYSVHLFSRLVNRPCNLFIQIAKYQ